MSFSIEILEKWKRRGEDNKSANTYQMIKGMLQRYCSDIVTVDDSGTNVFLQGSYANHTNIKNDSDIDVVVLSNSIFVNNAQSVLTGYRLDEFNRRYSEASYPLQQFKEDIYQRLNGKPLGQGYMFLRRGNKTIKFNENNEYPDFVAVDIVPAFEYRKYSYNSSVDKDLQPEGIQIYDSLEDEYIINYPKIHKKNGEDKNQVNRTDGNYKETVRIFKQIKKHLIDTNVIKEDLMPSYGLECMLYNVPDSKFRMDLIDRIDSIISWLSAHIQDDFREQNGIISLFDKTLDRGNAKIFIEKCIWLSNTWSK